MDGNYLSFFIKKVKRLVLKLFFENLTILKKKKEKLIVSINFYFLNIKCIIESSKNL